MLLEPANLLWLKAAQNLQEPADETLCMVLDAGSTIGGFRLEERLGGESLDVAVFRATSVGGGGDEAVVKILLQPGEEAKQMFLAMAKPRSGLPPHPNVVRTHRFGIDDSSGTPYVIQEFVSGPTFEQLPPDLSLWNRVRCGLEAAEALEYLHSYGVAHGGAIRAKHFRLDQDSQVRLVDLGNAYSGGLPPLPEPGHLRQRASQADILNDVLAYGSVLNDLLHPGMGESVTLRSIVEHCLAENPTKRALSLKVVIERLRAWIDSYPASMFEPKEAIAKSESVFALPKGPNPQTLFEASWTFAILSLSLAAVFGGLVENLYPRELLAPSGRENMIAIGSSLLVDANEVSQAEYLAFARQNGHSYSLQNRAVDLPAVGVNAFEASDYCQASGKHLPSVAELQTAVKAQHTGLRNLNDGVAEWIGGRAVPDFFLAKSFPALLYPSARVTEEWRKVHGSPKSLSGHRLAPARFAATDIGFRCFATAK